MLTQRRVWNGNGNRQVYFETAIPLKRKLVGVALADPAVPLTPSEPNSNASAPGNLSEPAPAVNGSNPEERAALEDLVASVKDLAQDLWEQQRQRLGEMQRVAVEVAIAVASRLVHQRIELGDYPVENLVREVVERLEPQDALTIYLHPADIALLGQRLGEKQPLFAEADRVKLVPDVALKRGDCRAETGDVNLSLELDKQLEEMRKRLLEILPEVEVEKRKEQPGDRQLRRFPERRHIA